MKCDDSLTDFALLQRSGRGARHRFRGSCRSAGAVLLTASAADGVLPGWRRRRVGTARNGAFSGVIDGLPVGGPYHLTLAVADASGRVREQTVVREVLIGDLWILAGQSNMQGYGYLPSPVPQDPGIRLYGMDNCWRVAREPLHDLAHAAAPAHRAYSGGVAPKIYRSVGPGMAFAAAMLQATGVPQGLIACAQGGTSLAEWSPELKTRGDASLYGAMLDRVRRLGGHVAGVLWYQGCAETKSERTVRDYSGAMEQWFAACRRDLRARRLPVVIAQIGRCAKNAQQNFWGAIRFQQLELLRRVPRLALAVTVDLELDDDLHLSAAAQAGLGRRMAGAMLRLLGEKEGVPQLLPRSCRLVMEPHSLHAVYEIAFSGVRGKLRSGSLPAGFSLLDEAGAPAAGCYRVELDGSRVRVHVQNNFFAMLRRPLPVAYGAGCDPVCNVTDETGTPLPAFRIMPAVAPRDRARLAETVRFAEVLGPLTVADDSDILRCPDRTAEGAFAPACFQDFCLLRPVPAEPENAAENVVYFRFFVTTREAMTLRLGLGSDGPFALYFDRRMLLRKETANPLIPEEFQTLCTASPGRHEVLVAQSSNRGRAWGVSCRVRRQGPGSPPELEQNRLSI